MAMTTNIHRFSEYQEDFELGLTQVHEDELRLIPRTYTAWLQEKTAEHFYDTDWGVSGLGVMPEKGIGSPVETDKIYKADTKQYDLTPYALGLVIQYEVYRWDLYGIFPGLMKELAKSATDRYNLVAYAILNNSFSTSDTTYQTFQGEVLCTDSHTRLDGGSWNNYDTVGLSYLGMQQAKIDLRKLVNERGRYVNVTPRQIITSVEQEWIAQELVRSSTRPDNANDAYNSLSGLRRIHTSPYITTSTHWWLQCNKRDIKMHLRLGDRPQMMFDSDVRTMNRIGHAYCSFGIGIWDSRGLWGSDGGA